MDAMQILVIILASFLAVFLLLAVILVVLLIKVTRQIKQVTTSAQTTVDHINNFTANAAKVTSPALIAKYVMDQVKKVRK